MDRIGLQVQEAEIAGDRDRRDGASRRRFTRKRSSALYRVKPTLNPSALKQIIAEQDRPEVEAAVTTALRACSSAWALRLSRRPLRSSSTFIMSPLWRFRVARKVWHQACPPLGSPPLLFRGSAFRHYSAWSSSPLGCHRTICSPCKNSGWSECGEFHLAMRVRGFLPS